MTAHDAILAGSMLVMVAGAAGTVFASDVTRMVIALGAFLVGVAAAFLVLGSTFLAAAEIFAYVGGVLVLVLFALMVTGRSGDERPRVGSRHDIGAAVTAVLVFGLLTWALVPVEGSGSAVADPSDIAAQLLGVSLPVFELAGLLLLLAVLGVLVIVKGGEDR